ncbi:hypothetical protein [Methylomonas koyamae]|uniref:hypothetical protein n=1 Tax=Methylomonas koyamae TaxID=702114 RepID=UPI0006D065AC|nr:hypothetical protein [Methylomonas koyamae]
MTQAHTIKTLAAAVSLLAVAQSANALTPWDNGPAEVKIFTSGGAAQDRAIEEAIKFGLAAPGTLDVFQDLQGTNKGRRFQGFYFTGAASLPAGLAGKRIYVEKRSLGAAGYGVVPLAGNIGLDHLDIFLPNKGDGTFGSSQLGAWQADGAKFWKAEITNTGGSSGQSAWNNYLVQNTLSDGGFTGVDAPALLAPGTDNYPEVVKEPSTNANAAGWNTSLTPAALTANNIARVPTGGLVYGIGVPLDFYKVLQVAQYKSGQLPADTLANIGKYDDESYIPSLSRDFLASLLAGSIKNWSDVKIVDRSVAGQPVLPLTDAPSSVRPALHCRLRPRSRSAGVTRARRLVRCLMPKSWVIPMSREPLNLRLRPLISQQSITVRPRRSQKIRAAPTPPMPCWSIGRTAPTPAVSIRL